MPTDTAHSSRVDASPAHEKHGARDVLEAKLREGLNTMERQQTPAEWRDIRAEALAAVEASKKAS